MKEKANDAFSVLLLMTVASVFAEMVFFAFVNITLVQFRGFSAINPIEFYQIKMWTFTQTLKLFFTTYVCHSTTKKALKTGVLVHRLFSAAPNDEFQKEVGPFLNSAVHLPENKSIS